MESENKKKALAGLISTALLQFKWKLESPEQDIIPTASESYEAYNNDPLIHGFTNVLISAIDVIENYDFETIDRINSCVDIDTGQKTPC